MYCMAVYGENKRTINTELWGCGGGAGADGGAGGGDSGVLIVIVIKSNQKTTHQMVIFNCKYKLNIYLSRRFSSAEEIPTT